MDNSDTSPVKAEDIWVALGLLTRLPLPGRDWNSTRPAAMAAWAYPLAGLVVAVLACLIATLLVRLGLPTDMIAAALLLCMSVFTGAMHEDGLADSADGLWGGATPERRLEIMKDSHSGAYGVITLIATFALRWAGLSALLAQGWLWLPVLVAATTSRAAMAFVMNALPNARVSGLSSLTGRPGKAAPRIAASLGAAMAVLGFGLAGLWVLLATVAATALCATIARAKIGGQTGDILGATQQVTEIAALGAICAHVL